MATYATWVTVLGASVDEVTASLRDAGFAALVGVEGDLVVVFAADDVGDVESPAAALISAGTGGVAVAMSVFDDVVTVFVYVDGEPVVGGAVVDADSGFADGAPVLDADELHEAVGRGDLDAVMSALDGDADADARATALTKALGLPVWAVGWGFEHLNADRSGFAGPVLLGVG